MAEKWGWITQNLEREDREFKEAMKGQVGTTSSSSNNSKKMGSLKKCLLGHWYYCPVYNRKEKKPKILDYVYLWAALISIETHSLLYPFFT